MKHTTEVIKENALKCKTRKEFNKRFSGAYRAAHTRGILDEVCEHMSPNPRAKCLTLKALPLILKHISKIPIDISTLIGYKGYIHISNIVKY
jgi:hypothetical protein